MPIEIDPKPKINNADFVPLFDMKRYFIVDLASLIAKAKVTKPDLLAASEEIDKEMSGARVKALLRNEPVTLPHAKVFVQAINKLLEQKGYQQDRLQENDAVEGAFFIIDGFGQLLSERQILPAYLASQTPYPEKLITAAVQGYRLTLSTALDLLRSLNRLAPSDVEPINASRVIITDHRKGRKAAATGCLAHRANYVKWPPETLLEEDVVRGSDSANVSRLRR